ncbi:MAG TPA: PAS domain S-box protein [Thermoanaerobaculia bacterium]|jgi:PAS domain S-box-containing protein|nr:PAS domain S-box protein [Thermoanaerobaculia bacterium]
MVKLPIVDQMISLVRKPGAPPLPGAPREARLRDAFEHAPVGIALASMDGAWLQFNERFREIAGYSREQLSRLTFTDLTHPDDARREATLMRRMLGGDAAGYRIEKRIIEKRGKYRDVEVLCSIAGRDEGAPFLVYIVDERARTAQGQIRPAVQSSEQLLIAVVDQLTDFAIIRTDDNGLIAGWNAGAERILGYSREEVIGRPRRMLYRDHEHWGGKSTAQLQEARESGRIDLEDWRVRKDGQHLWVRTSLTPVRINGAIKGFVEIIRAPDGRVESQAKTKQTIEALRTELHKRQQTEEALRSAIDELRVNGEQTMDELKIMTDALRKELDRRKRAEEELRAIHERVAKAVVPPKAPAESEIVSTSMPPQRKWKPVGAPAELLVKHASQLRTGRLVIVRGKHEKELFIDKGTIISCSSNDPARFLAQRLIAAGMITEEQRQKALDIQRETQLALGRILIILGALTENQLHDAMRAKAADEIRELSAWTDAKYVFVEEEIPTLQLVPLRIDVAELIVHQLEGREDVPGALEAIDVAGIVYEAVTDLVIDDISSAADEITHNIEAIASNAEILVANASGKTKRFHRASCAAAKRFADETRVVFMSAVDASGAGYDACRMCFRA